MEKIAVIGLGYVGLPLAVEFGKKYDVIGFDINRERIKNLQNGIDTTLEVDNPELVKSTNLIFTDDKKDLALASIYIITVPTPIDEFKNPDLNPLISASRIVSEFLESNNIVIYESTVYPGCTEEVCIPELEKGSGLKFNLDFYCGYSPERINPGDRDHRLVDIKKVVSGSKEDIAIEIEELYNSIITAGTHKVSSIKVAEACKVIENTQRDLNIAFVNELAKIFHTIGIDTTEVLEAAATKWNFLNFKPGLVGGHCIGVDPYYLTYKAESMGYHPEIILAGRRINDGMPIYIAGQIAKLLSKLGKPLKGCRSLILGVTFKENCPDVRNSKVIDLIGELEEYGMNVEVYDPLANSDELKNEYRVELKQPNELYDCIVHAVSHSAFKDSDWHSFLNENGILYDVKGEFNSRFDTYRL